MDLKDKEIYDEDEHKWYRIVRIKGLLGKELKLKEVKYGNISKFPTGNHLFFSNKKGLYYKERSDPPITPQPGSLEENND